MTRENELLNALCRGEISGESYLEYMEEYRVERLQRNRVEAEKRRSRRNAARMWAVRLCEKRAESLATAIDTVMPIDVIRARWDAYEDAVQDAADVGVRITGYPVIEG